MIPRAIGGNTEVFLPKKLPQVVLKKSGREAAITRFHQMQFVRSILRYQKSSHLTIPKAKLCGDFLVEQRLPINVNTFYNMQLYSSNPKLFNEAVAELTRLFSKAYLSDLLGVDVYHPICHNSIKVSNSYVRYDNLPLYVVEENGVKKGKIGLIDLEHIQETPNPRGLETLVRIFPLHLDIIKKEAGKLNVEFDEDKLVSSSEKGLEDLQFGFIDHLNFLKKIKISTKNIYESFKVTSSIVNNLTTLVKEELLKINQGIGNLSMATEKYGGCINPDKDFFLDNPEESADKVAAKITALIIKNITNLINNNMKEKKQSFSGKRMEEYEMVDLRSSTYDRLDLSKGVREVMEPTLKKKSKGFQAIIIAERLSYLIMQNLVTNGKIHFFNPGFYTGSHNLCTIRY